MQFQLDLGGTWLDDNSVNSDDAPTGSPLVEELEEVWAALCGAPDDEMP